MVVFATAFESKNDILSEVRRFGSLESTGTGYPQANAESTIRKSYSYLKLSQTL
jgi:hypothetical protein